MYVWVFGCACVCTYPRPLHKLCLLVAWLSYCGQRRVGSEDEIEMVRSDGFPTCA